MRIPETSHNTIIAPTCQCSTKPIQPDQMAALDALFKRLEVNTIPRQTEDAVVIHQGSGPVIMSLNQSFQNINNSADRMNATFGRMNATLDRINATLDRIEASLDSCLKMTKELLRIVKMPGFLEAFNAKKQAQIENVETEAHA